MARKIMIVDDDPSIVKELKEILESKNYSVIGIHRGEECFERALEEMPDIILLDVLLAGSSGLAICKRLKNYEGTKSIPIILVTALLGVSIQGEGLECGAAHVISKPYAPEDLLWTIEDTIKKSAKERVRESPP